MAQSPDHPQLVFVQAKKYTTGRPDGPPLWIIVHDMEAAESGTTAEATANYFANLPDGRSVSAHYCADNNSVVQCVKLADSAYTVGNRQGNNRGINYEMAGYARQTRAEWLDDFGLDMFHQVTPIMRADAAKFGIPLERRTRAELLAKKPGVTCHADLAAVFGGSDHTDPGPNFPWDVFMQILTGEATDMALRYQFKGFPDQPSSNSAGFSRVHISDGLHYRIQQFGAAIDQLVTLAGAGPVTLVTPENCGIATYAAAVGTFCGHPYTATECSSDNGGDTPAPPAASGEFTFTGTGTLTPAAPKE